MISGEYRTLSQFERRAARFRACLLGRTAICGALTLGIATGIAPRAAKAGPQGTVVVGGGVDIQQAGTHTEFTQHSQTAILNHSSFDINVNESVNFAQPGTQALAVNRIVGSDLPTSIAGKLTANGNVWVLNPSGVAIQGTAQVNVGGLIATTAGISDEAIMAGQRSFAGAPDGSSVTNAGSISAGEGSVVLVAPVVGNTGTITTKGSDVALGAGSGFTVDFDGDGLTRFEVTPGNGVSLSNTGAISAQGGAAYLSAASAEAVQTAVVSIGGRVEATRIEEKGGVIVISGGDTGVTEISGELDASQVAGDGGRVIVTGDLVDVKETAAIDASGAGSGGSVEIGGAFQGAAIQSDVVVSAGAPATTPLPTAKRTVVRRGATIAADAGVQGDGGEVIVWADESTGFRGAISARGGSQGGDGGNAEVSGKQNLLFDGSVDLSSPSGAKGGSLLLDPDDVVIELAAASGDDGELSDNEILAGEGAGTFTISNTAVVASVLADNTTIAANNTITQNTGATLTLAGTNALSLTAGGDITLNAAIVGTDNPLTFTSTGGTVVFGAGSSVSSAGAIEFDVDAAFSIGAVTASAGGALNVTTTNDAITQVAGTSISAGSVVTTFDAGTGDVTLTEATNNFGANGSGAHIAVTGGAIQITDANSVQTGAISGTSLALTAGGNAALGVAALAGTTTDITGGDITVNADSQIFVDQNVTTTTSGNIALNADVDVAAGTDDIIVAGGTTVSAAGTLSFSLDGGDLTSTDASETVTLVSGGVLTLPSADFDGGLSLAANGAVTDASTLLVADDLSVLTSGDIVTLNGANSIGGTISVDTTDGGAAAAAVTLVETGAIDLGTIAASALTVTTGGDTNITDAAGSTISVSGTTSLTAGGDIVVNDAGENTFGGTVNLSADRITGFAAASALTLGTVTTSDNNQTNSFNVSSSLDFAGVYTDGSNSDLSVTAGGAVTQSGGTITTDQATIVTTGDAVTLTQANEFSGAVAVDTTNAGAETAAAVSLTDVSGITLGAITASDLSVTSDDVEINAAVALGAGTATFTNTSGAEMNFGAEPGGEWGLSNAELGNVAAGTVAAITNDQDFRLTSVTQLGENLSIAAGTGTVRYVGANSGLGDFTVVSALNFAQVAGTDSLNVGSNDVSITASGDIAVQTLTAGSLTLTPGDDISFAGISSVSGAVTADAGTRDITLFSALIAGGGMEIRFDPGAALTAGSVTLTTAGGAITANAGSLGDADTTLTATGAGDVTVLGLTAGDLSVDAGTGAVAFNDAATSVDALTVSASASIDQNAAGTLGVTGATDLTSAGNIALDSDNDFGGAVSASGVDVTLTDTGALALGTVAVTGNLTVTAGGAISDTDLEAIVVAGTTSLSASDGVDEFDIVLDNGLHDFDEDISGDALTFLGADVTLSDIDRLTLGASTATGTTLDLTAIDFDLAGLVTVGGGTGTATLTSPDHFLGSVAIFLTDAGGNALNVDFSTADAANLDTGLAIFEQSAGGFFDVVITDFDSGTTIGDITINAADGVEIGSGALPGVQTALFRGGLTLEATGDVVNQTAGGADTSLSVVGATSITGDAVTLDDADNDFGGTVDVAADGAVTLVDANDITLGSLTGASLDLTSDDVAITTSVSVTGQASFTNASGAQMNFGDTPAGEWGLSDTELGGITAGSVVATTGDQDFRLTDVTQLDDNLTINAGTGTVRYVGTNTGLGDFIVASSSSVAQGDSTDSLDAGDNAVGLTATDDVSLRNITAGSLGVSVGDDVSVFGTNTISGTATIDAGTNPISIFAAVTPADGTTQVEFDTGAALTAETLTYTTTGAVNAGTGTLTSGATSLVGTGVAVSGLSADTTDGIDNDLSITAGIGTVTFDTADTTVDNLTVVSSGEIAQTADGGLIVAGDADLTSTGNVSLTAADNDFSTSTISVDADGSTTINDVNAIGLGAFDIGGNLTVTAGGTITDKLGEKISVTGTTSLLASDGGTEFFDIQLDNSVASGDAEDVAELTGAVTMSGEDITLVNGKALSLAAVTTNVDATEDTTIAGNDGDLTVRAAGSIVNSAGTMSIDGDADFLAESLAAPGTFFDILLNGTNTVSGVFSASGEDVRLDENSGNAVEIGTVIARDTGADTTLVPFQGNGSFQLLASGGATDGTTGSITAEALFVSGSGADFIFDNEDAHTVGLLTSSLGSGTRNVTLNNEQGLTLGQVGATLNLTGALTVSAEGTIVSADNRIIVTDLDLSAVNDAGDNFFDIQVANAANEFTGTITLTGEDISLANSAAGGTTLGVVSANADDTIDALITGAAGDLTLVSTGGAITDTAGDAISVAGTASLLAESTGGDFFDIRLDGDDADATDRPHDFGGIVAEGEDISIVDVDGFDLGNVTAHDDSLGTVDTTIDVGNDGDLFLLAGGAITQVASTTITVPGDTEIVTTGAVTLDQAANDFGKIVSVDADAATLTDASAIVLGDVDIANGLTVTAGGSITDDGDSVAGGDVDVGGEARLTADASGTPQDIVLNDAFNNFSTVSADGASVTVTDVDALTLGAITATGGLTVTAGGAISDTGSGAIKVSGATSLSASDGVDEFDIVLDNGLHDFDEDISGDALTFLGANVTLSDIDNLRLGASTATGTTLDLTAVDFDLAGLVTVGGGTGTATLTSPDHFLGSVAIFLTDGDANALDVQFTSADAANLDTGLAVFEQSAGGFFDVVITDFDSGTAIGDITINAADGVEIGSGALPGVQTALFRGGLTLEATGDVVNQTAGGADTSLSVVGATSITGDAVTLDDADNDFGGTVDVTATSATLVDASAIILGAVDVANDFAVTAGGTITDTDAVAIEVGGATSLLATDGGAGRFDIVLDNGLHDFDEDISGDALSFDGANVTLTDIDRLTLGASTTTGTLIATAVDFDINGTVSVAGGTGTATLNSPLFLLSDANSLARTDADTNAFTLAFTSTDAGNLDTGTTTLVGTDAVDGAITVNDFDSGTAIGDVVLESALSIFIGEGATFPGTATATFRGDLTMVTGAGSLGDILQVLGDVGLVVLGDTQFTAADAVVLSDADNDFQGKVSGSAARATLVDANAIALGALDIENDLSVTAGGAITDTGGEAIQVGGATSLVASDGGAGRFDILLDNGLHDFNDDDVFVSQFNDTPGGGANALSFDGAAVTITDLNRLVLGASSSLGDVDITANDVALTGAVDVNTAGGDPGNVFFRNNGGSIGLGDQPGTSSTTNLGYLFTNTDAQNLSADVVNFEADALGRSIISNNFDTGGTDATASFDTLVLDGNEVIFAATGGTDIVRGNLQVEANNFVSQGAGGTTGTLRVTGTTAITVFDDDGGNGGDAGPITLASATNDFGDAVSASASDVTLRDANAILLDTVTAGGGLTVTAGGAITDTDGSAISVSGATSLTAGGDILLDGDDADGTDQPHDFSVASAFNATGDAISIVDANAILLGTVTGDSIAVLSNDVDIATSVSVTGLASFTNGAGDEMTLGFADLDPATWDLSAAEVSRIAATEIRLATAGNGGSGIVSEGIATDESLTLDAGTDGVVFTTSGTSVGGNLAITAGDTVEQDTAGGVTVDGTTDISAGDSVTGFADIQLALAANDFVGKVSATGGDIFLTDVNGLSLGTIDANVNADPSVTPNVGLLAVIVDSGSIFDTDGEKIDVEGLALLEAAAGSIALDNGLHDFNSGAAGDAEQVVIALATDITLTDINSIRLGDIDAGGNLTVTAGTSIVDDDPTVAGDGVDVAGNTSLSAGGDILLDEIVHDFDSNDSGSVVDAAGDNISLGDATSIVLGNIDAAGNLTVRAANGSISDDATAGAGLDIEVAGVTSLSASGAIILDDVTNDFDKGGDGSDEVDATGTSIILTDANSIGLGNIDATGTLTVRAITGNIVDDGATASGEGVEVAGLTSLSAGGNILLDDIVNDFDKGGSGDRVDATAGNIALGDATSIVLGAIDASGTLTVRAVSGAITDSGQGISVAGVTSLSASGNVTLDDVINDFDDDSTGDRVDAAGSNVTLVDANAIVLGDIDATSGLTVLAKSGSITDNGSSSAGGDVDSGGLARLEATTEIVLDDLFHDFGTVDMIAPTILLNDRNAVVLGAVTTDTLTVTAGGAITDTDTKAITVTGDTSLLASSTAGTGSTEGVPAESTFAAALAVEEFFDIILDGSDALTADRPHDFGGIFTATGADLSVVDANAILLGNVTANPSGTGDGDLTILAGGDITQVGGTAVLAPGAGDIRTTAGVITLTESANDLADELNGTSSTVSLNATGDVTVVDVDSIALGASSGANFVLDSTDVSAAGTLAFTNITLTNSAGDAIVFGNAANDGNADDYDITDAGVGFMQASLVTLGTAGGGITVEGAALDTESLVLDSGTGATSFTTATTTVAGDLTVRAGGQISQTAQGAIEVAGKTSLTAGAAIALGAAANNFDSDAGAASDATDEVDATGTAISLRDADAIALGAITGSSLTVNAGGSITDTVGDAISITGATSMAALNGSDAFDIRLDGDDADSTDKPHDFSDTAAFSARGEDILIVDANAIRFGTVQTGDGAGGGTADLTIDTGNDGDLTVDAGGDITQSGTMLVRGDATFTAPDNITLGGDNDFRAIVDADAGAVVLNDTTAIVLGTVTADTLTVSANGTISDTAGRIITVSGTTDLSATDGESAFHDIVLDSTAHDFAAAGGAFTAVGEDLSVRDANAINFGAVTLNAGDGSADASIAGDAGNMTVVAGADVTQTGILEVPGETSLTTPGNVTLALANLFGSSVNVDANVVTLRDANAIRLGAITAGGNLTVTAGGAILDTDGRTIEVAGVTSLSAVSAGGTNFFDILLDNDDAGDVHELGTRVDASGEDIRLSNVDALLLGTVAPHEDSTPDTTIDNGNNGDLTVRAGGTVTQQVALTIPGELNVTALDFGAGDLFDVLLALDNQIGGIISVSAEDASIRNVGGQTKLGAITTHDHSGGVVDTTINTGNDGDLTVVSTAGSIIDTAGKAILVSGTTSLLASGGGNFFDIALDNADTHDFTGAVNATGEDIILDDKSAIVLGAIDANESGEDAGSGTADETIAFFDDNGDGTADATDGVASAGDLTVRAGGTITETGAGIDVEGRTRLEARSGTTVFDVTLDQGTHDFDSNTTDADALHEVDIDAASVVLTDASAIKLGDVSATGGLDLTAAGSITDTAGEAVTVGGTTTLVARSGSNFFDIALDNADTHDFTGAVNATGEDIILDDKSAIVLGAIDANESGEDAGSSSADETIAFFDDNGDGTADATDGVASAGDLTVRAGGTITETGAGIDVEGRTRLEARNGTTVFDVTLDQGTHDFDSNTTDADALQEVDIDAASVVLTDASAIKLGDVSATGGLDLTAAGSITDTAGEAVTVGGTTTLVARSGSNFFDIALDNADTHDFAGAVNATGEDIILDDKSAIVLGAIDANESGEDAGSSSADETIAFFDDNGDGTADATDGVASAGDLTVRAGGTITETGAGIDVEGRTRLEARNGTTVFDVTLDQGTHDFDSNTTDADALHEVDIDAASVVLTDASAIKLGDVSATGGLDLTAAGSITDTAGEAVTVGGTTTLVARSGSNFFDIALDNADTHDFTGAVNATGEDIILDDKSAIVLGAIDANESGEDAGSSSADETIAFFDDNGDGTADGTDGVASAGDLTVRAGGTITETGAGIDVEGRTRLEARNGTTVFDVTLDQGTHDFDSNTTDADALHEVDIDAASVVLTDASAIKLGEVSATGDVSVTAGGSVTDTDGEAIDVDGRTTVLAVNDAGDDFFDIRFDNPDLHDFNVVDLTGEGIVVFDVEDLTIASIKANSDDAADATVPDNGRGHGSIELTVNKGDFAFDPNADDFEADAADPSRFNIVSLQADGNITLTAPEGSFGVLSGGDIVRRKLQDGMTFRSTSGNILLQFANGFTVADASNRGPFTLDAATGNSKLIIGNEDQTEFLGIGTADFLEDAQKPGFNPLFVLADIGDAQLFTVTGNFGLTAAHPLTVRVQNTSLVPNEGAGTTVVGTTGLSGRFEGLTLFGSFNGASRTVASLQGFVNDGGFVVSNKNTVNGCVILLPSACQPIGSLTLALDFPDGLLLGVKFLDPDEDLDDPFTNRGDEEEWE